MVTLYVAGKAVGTLDDAARMLAGFLGPGRPVEFRDAAGAHSAPAGEDDCDPDWVKAISPEETARRMAGPFLTLEEYRRQQGEV